jgi:hypothetical protein
MTSARDGNEDGDDDDEDRGGRERIAKERERHVSVGKGLGHDAGADHRHDEKERAQRLCRQAPCKMVIHSATCSHSIVFARLDRAIQ